MRRRKWIVGAIAATFFIGSITTPDRAEAGPADGLFGLAAGVIIGSAMSQRQPAYDRTYRPRRVYYRAARRRAPVARQVYVSRQKSRAPVRASSDPFATQVKAH